MRVRPAAKYKDNYKLIVKVNRADTFSLDDTLAQIILPSLKEFRKHNFGIPMWAFPEGYDHGATHTSKENDTIEKAAIKKRDEVIDKMIYAFDGIVNEKFFEGLHGEEWRTAHFEEERKINEGLELFGKYFRSLWW